MTTTLFKPSIHGWPFGNHFDKTYVFGSIKLSFGFCGGMCWQALERFYSGTCIPRPTPDPREGEALFDELYEAQKDSLSGGKIWQILRWQESPDLSHDQRQSSLGHRTQVAWPEIRDQLRQGRPITITVITSSNNYNLNQLKNNHRVIAFDYSERPVTAQEGAPEAAHTAVSISIYDPNYPDDDDVQLSFYLGGVRSNIRLRHNRGRDVHGFFADDRERAFARSDRPAVYITHCQQVDFCSSTLATYRVQFDWWAPVIPYYRFQIDGEDWKHNGEALGSLEPKGAAWIDKQCPTCSGRLELELTLPRTLTRLTVRLFNRDDACRSIPVDVRPGIVCLPYVHERVPEDGPQIVDSALTANDQMIRVTHPSDADVRALDTSPYRWVICIPPRDRPSPSGGSRTGMGISVTNDLKLGNVRAPVRGHFQPINLAEPVTLRGTVWTSRTGQARSERTLASLARQGQVIFNGFQADPEDYDLDTTVEFKYTATDRFGVSASASTLFFGRSLLCERLTRSVPLLDTHFWERYEQAAHWLVEHHLIDLVGSLQLPDHPPKPMDPLALLSKLQNHRTLQASITNALKQCRSSRTFWDLSWVAQVETATDLAQALPVTAPALQESGSLATPIAQQVIVEQEALDMALVGVLAGQAMKALAAKPTIIKALRALEP